MKEIVIATQNKGKIKEFKQMLEKYRINVLSLADFTHISFPEVEETGTTFVENAKIKAEAYRKLLNKPVLADDSGLVIDALDGRPGVYSARYAGEAATDEENIDKVLDEMQDIELSKRTARFVAVLALAIPNSETLFFEGACEGVIAESPRGENGFGYDPIFVPKGSNRTMAELSSEEKNRISHRYHALEKMKIWLENH